MTARAALLLLVALAARPAAAQAPGRPAPVPRPLPPDVSWVDQPPPDAAALAADPAAYSALLEAHGLALDLDRGQLAMRGATLHDEASLAGYPVEYLVVTERGRAHEALFLVKAQPSLVDACLRALGAAPGSPMHYAPREPPPSRAKLEAGASPWVVVPPAGALVDVRVAFSGPDGAPREIPLESALLDLRTGEPLPRRDWAYTGGTFGPLRQGRGVVQVFQGDAQGNVIGISPLDRSGTGVCVLERNSDEGADDSLYGVNGALAPARGTPVTLLLRPTGARTAPAPGPRPEEVVDGEDGARLDAWLSRVATWGFSGVVLAERGGRVVLHKGWGLADRALGLPVTTATVFPVSSIAKQFTAAAILQLEAEGKLRLDDILARHLEGVTEDKKDVTLRHLLQHVAGLPERTAAPDGESATLSSDRRATVARILATPLVSEPGREFRYSNLGYALLAAVVESAADDIYRGYLGERLFGPAGLTSAGLFGEPRWSADRLARGLSGPPGAQQPAPQPAFGPLTWEQVGAGAVVCSVRDLQRWVHALLDGTLLPEAQRQVMFTPGTGGYGCAWWIEDDGERGRVAWHDGLIEGYRSEVRRWLDADATVIVAGNTELHGLAQPLGRLLFGEAQPLPPEPAAPDPGAAAALAGAWRSADGVRLELRAPADDAGALWIVPQTQAALDLLDGISGGERARRAKFGARTVAFLVAVANARWDECAAVLGPEASAPDCEQTFGPWWTLVGEGLGSPVEPRVLAVGSEHDALAVDIEVQFSGGAARRRVLWRDGELVDIRLPGGALGARRLLPAAQGGWVCWTLEQGAGPALQAVDEGGEARLRLVAPGGAVAELRREP